MSEEASSYLKFLFKWRILKLIILPFGYTSSPKIFTKILRPLLAKLCTQALLVSFFLDDSWQGGETYTKSLNCCIKTFTLLQKYAFFPNLHKSQLIPTQVLEILGNIVDSIKMCLWLPKKKEDAVIDLLSETLQMHTMSMWHVASVIGKLIPCTVACSPGNVYNRNNVLIRFNMMVTKY